MGGHPPYPGGLNLPQESRPHKNVSVEIGGGFPARGQVEMAVRELGAERIIYGSDVSGRGFASQLAKVYGAAISEREKELIFSGNFRRLVAPIARAKGIAIQGALWPASTDASS